MIRLLVQYILTAAVRDRLLFVFLLLVVLGMSLGSFLGGAAITEQDQFSVVFAAGGLRIAGMLTLVLFVVFYLRRSFESRDVEYLLARPVSRLQFLLAHSFAFSILATVVALIITGALMLMPAVSGEGAFILWGLTIWIEYLIMVNVALFFAFVLSSAVSATMVCMAFYVLARLIGDILGIIQGPAGDKTPVIMLMEKIMLLISVFNVITSGT